MTSSQNNKIAVFVPTLQPGGAERVALNLAGGFVRRGFAVDILVASEAGDFGNLIPRGVRLISLGNKGRVLRALPHLIRYLHREAPSWILPIMDHTNVVAIWACWLARSRTSVLATAHCLPSIEAKTGQRLREKLSPIAVRIFLRFANGVVAVSNGVAEDLAHTARIAEKRIAVIPNPVLTPEYYEKLVQDVPDYFPANSARPVVISVGRLVKSKDFPTLIRAFAKVMQKLPSRLLILGEGDQRSVIERLIEDLNLQEQVMMPGYTDNPYPHIARAKVLVLSSMYEAFGNVIVEALGANTLVVATDCPGPREILQDGKLGELVPVGNSEALAQAVLKALTIGGPIPSKSELQKYQLDSVVDAYVSAMMGATN